jgi:hypothetical protein
LIHLYAFAEGLTSLPERRGVAGEELELRGVDDLTAVVGRVPAAIAESPDAVLAHGLVVESLLDHGKSVLPARFARPFASDSSLVAATTPRLQQLRERLARVRGCVELAVRVAETEVDPPPRGVDGASYLRVLGATRARRAAVAQSVHTAFRALAVESAAAPLAQAPTLLQAAYLVRRDDVNGFARLVEGLAATSPELIVVCTGPWAPYSFAGEAA